MGKMNREIEQVTSNGRLVKLDHIAIEEPLEILIKYPTGRTWEKLNLSITMRTPGHDEELVIGFLYAEGIISNASDITDIRSRGPMMNTIEVSLKSGKGVDALKLARLTLTNSSCGVCGKSSIDFIGERGVYIHRQGLPSFPTDIFYKVLEQIQAAQTTFKETGGVHAAAIFTPQGDVIVSREDVGRHNAMDKVIGFCLKSDLLPLKDHGVLFSGRTSFELLQKAHMAGIPLTVSVGAPSSLAVELAEETGMSLLGFLRRDKLNIYTDDQRLKPATT